MRIVGHVNQPLKNAGKCPKCGADQRNFLIRHKVITGIIGFFVLMAIFSIGSIFEFVIFIDDIDNLDIDVEYIPVTIENGMGSSTFDTSGLDIDLIEVRVMMSFDYAEISQPDYVKKAYNKN